MKKPEPPHLTRVGNRYNTLCVARPPQSGRDRFIVVLAEQLWEELVTLQGQLLAWYKPLMFEYTYILEYRVLAFT